MATFKKSAKKKKTASRKPDVQAQAERLSKTLTESAQQIWHAGVGAFGRAQVEGNKLFEGLVKEGLNLEQTARKLAGGRADVVRDAVESRVEQARGRATDTWDRLEKVFEDRVQRALTKLGVPGRDDLTGLSQRVESLTAELRRQNGGATRKPATARKTAARKAVATKTAKPKTATKSAKTSPARKKAATTKRTTKAAKATGKTSKRARKSTLAKSATPSAPNA